MILKISTCSKLAGMWYSVDSLGRIP